MIMYETWKTLGAVTAVIGGAAWIIKAGAILTTGVQPPLSFELGPPLFVVALWCLLLLVWSRSTLMVYAVVILAFVTLGFAAALALHLFADGPHALHSLGISLGLLLSLVLVGLRVLRVRLLPPPWHRLPFWMGVLFVPLLAVLGAIGALSGPVAEERLIEVPLLLFGLAWLLLGVRLIRTRAEDDREAIQPTPGPQD